MTLDITDRDSIYNTIIACATDSKAQYALATAIRNANRSSLKLAKHNADENNAAQTNYSALEGLQSLSAGSSDAEIRAGARALLIARLKSGEVKGADFGQFIDRLGISAEDVTTPVYLVDFAGALQLGHDAEGLPANRLEELRSKLVASDWGSIVPADSAVPGADPRRVDAEAVDDAVEPATRDENEGTMPQLTPLAENENEIGNENGNENASDQCFPSDHASQPEQLEQPEQ